MAIVGEGRMSIWKKNYLVLGMGGSKEPWTARLEPEAYCSLRLEPHQRVKLGVGFRRSHQTPFLFTERRHFASVPVDPGDLIGAYEPSWKDAPAVEMDQTSLHGEFHLSSHYSIDVDAYYRRYDNLTTWQWDDELKVNSAGSAGDGTGAGYEISFHRRVPSGLSLTASLGRTEVTKKEGTLNQRRTGDFDMPQARRLTITYPLTSKTTISLSWQDLDGRPYTPLDLEEGPPTDEEVNSLRLPHFRRLDVKLQQRIPKEDCEINFFIDVINLLDWDNEVMRTALEVSPGQFRTWRYWGTRFFPIVGVSVRWS
jgi:hypothetical protein